MCVWVGVFVHAYRAINSNPFTLCSLQPFPYNKLNEYFPHMVKRFTYIETLACMMIMMVGDDEQLCIYENQPAFYSGLTTIYYSLTPPDIAGPTYIRSNIYYA